MSDTIITNADVKKFLTLLKAGLKHGANKELGIYTASSISNLYPDCRYVNLKLSFFVKDDIIDELFADEDFDATNQVNDLMSGL